jgi:hypothetical protein
MNNYVYCIYAPRGAPTLCPQTINVSVTPIHQSTNLLHLVTELRPDKTLHVLLYGAAGPLYKGS